MIIPKQAVEQRQEAAQQQWEAQADLKSTCLP